MSQFFKVQNSKGQQEEEEALPPRRSKRVEGDATFILSSKRREERAFDPSTHFPFEEREAIFSSNEKRQGKKR
jgi:hypothetical protein